MGTLKTHGLLLAIDNATLRRTLGIGSRMPTSESEKLTMNRHSFDWIYGLTVVTARRRQRLRCGASSSRVPVFTVVAKFMSSFLFVVGDDLLDSRFPLLLN